MVNNSKKYHIGSSDTCQSYGTLEPFVHQNSHRSKNSNHAKNLRYSVLYTEQVSYYLFFISFIFIWTLEEKNKVGYEERQQMLSMKGPSK